MSLIKSFSQLAPLVLIVVCLLSYNYMSAQWSGPTAAPPGSNKPAPINVGTSTDSIQTGTGSVLFNRFSASTAVWSPLYCDAVGGNCFNPASTTEPSMCPNKYFMTGISQTGDIVCAAASSTAPNCTTQSTTVSGCYYGSGSPACPAGYTKSGPSYQGGRCSTNNDTWYSSCFKTVCS